MTAPTATAEAGAPLAEVIRLPEPWEADYERVAALMSAAKWAAHEAGYALGRGDLDARETARNAETDATSVFLRALIDLARRANGCPS